AREHADRPVAAAPLQLLRRRADHRVSDRLRQADEPLGGRRRDHVPSVADLPARPRWPAARVRRHHEVPERSSLARPHPVLRVLPRWQRRGAGGQPSDGMDGTDRMAHEVGVHPRSEGSAAEGLRRGRDEDDQGTLNSEGGFRPPSEPLPRSRLRGRSPRSKRTVERVALTHRMPRRFARSSTLFVSWVSSGTLPSGVIRSTTSGRSCERPRDVSSWLRPARREISSIPSFPKICVIASGGICWFAPRPTHELACSPKPARWSCSSKLPRPPPPPVLPPAPPPSICPSTPPSPPPPPLGA